MKSFSQEKSRQREEELRAEVERIQQEIKILQKTSEEGANISDKLNKEVGTVNSNIDPVSKTMPSFSNNISINLFYLKMYLNKSNNSFSLSLKTKSYASTISE